MRAKQKLELAPGYALPIEVVTETVAILGRRGSGKTHTASVLAEELLKQGCQVVIIDPLDVWKGLRSSADGKSEGFPVVVFGGDDADVPLDGTQGVALANAIIETGVSSILSLRHLSKGAARRFVGDFCEQLYQRKGEAKHQAPLHLIVDEADAFVPQRPQPDGMKAYGALDTIVRRGRSSGFGTSLISQRAAVIAKDVLTQTEILICHQTTGPQDKKALQAWVDANDDEGHGGEFIPSLARLKVGEAWLWSPALLRVFERVKIRRRETFDSSSTPKAGGRKIAPRKLAKVDVENLRSRLAPKEKTKPTKASGPDNTALRNEKARLEREIQELTAIIGGAHLAWNAAVTELVKTKLFPACNVPASSAGKLPEPSPSLIASATKRPAVSSTEVPKGEEKILAACIQHPDGCKRDQLTILTGYKRSTRDAYIQRLKGRGYVEQSGPTILATAEGKAALPNFTPLPTGEALVAHWLSNLPEGEVSILRVVHEHGRISRDDISTLTEYKRSTRDAYIQRLRSRQLVLVSGGIVALSETLGGA